MHERREGVRRPRVDVRIDGAAGTVDSDAMHVRVIDFEHRVHCTRIVVVAALQHGAGAADC